MFFTYLSRELRRRWRQTVVVALGLGLGVGLVVTVTAMSAGVHAAQDQVLHSLYGVGTDATVTVPATFGSGGPQRFGLNPGDQNQQGQAFTRDRAFSTPGLATFAASQASSVAGMAGVSQAAGGLTLLDIHISGTFARGQPVGGGFGGGFGGGGGSAQPTVAPSVPPIKVNSFSIAGVDVTQLGVGPLSSSTVTSGRTFSGSDATAKVAVVDGSYAKQQNVKVGSTLTIGGTKHAVVGIVSSPTGGGGSNVYLPLAQAQRIASAGAKVNQVYVRAASSTQIARVKSEIESAYPKATVTTASDLAKQVSGSLSSASNLAGTLGRWLAIAALIAAIAIASLLTLSGVSRRVREFGTLKAIGWHSRRVVGQVMGESLVRGILGGIVGIGVGLLGAASVTHFAPTLHATVSALGTGGGRFGGGGFGPPGGATGFGPGAGGGGPFAGLGRTVSVPLTAPLHVNVFALAIGLALLGGLLAGTLGGWRAARLRPAEALRRVE